MARGRNRASSPPSEVPGPQEEDDVEVDDALQPLQFGESLAWRAGKALAVGELLRRLKELHAELVDIQQEAAHRPSLVPVAQELAHTNLLTHRDRGVKAWTAACLVEMFRLLAPDAPYKGSQLKDIFSLFINSILPALGNPTDPYNDQHLRTLTSLNEVKSVVLLTDLPGADVLIGKLFLTSFDILSDTARPDGEELSKNVEYHLTGMLATLVDESVSTPPNVVDTVLAQFLRVDPSAWPLQMERRGGKPEIMQLQQLPPAYNMAKNICTACPEKMSRAVSQYFSAIIVDASENSISTDGRKSTSKRHRDSEDSEDNDRGPRGPSEDDLQELQRAHRLLRELWRSAPLVIQNIVPQLDAELSTENVNLRLLATETVGDLISGIGAAGPPAAFVLDPVAYPSQSLEPASARNATYNILTTPAAPHAFSSVHATAYHSFMNRRNDKSPRVRCLWVTCAGRIISTSAGGVGLDHGEENNILQYVADMLVDSDEHVRLAAIQAIGRCDFEMIMSRFGAHGSITEQGSVLCNLADRIKDRKTNVRTAAMELLGRIWGVASGAIAEGSERVRSLLASIPSKIFEAIYINDAEINRLVLEVIFNSLLPLNYPPIKAKAQPATNGHSQSQRIRDSQTQTPSQAEEAGDPDAIRAERILILARDLEPKAKTVFFAMQSRQAKSAQYLEAFLKRCEDYNGGVTGKDGKETKEQLSKLIDFFAKAQPDSAIASDHLWKFAKKHERRAYQLIRFTIDPESDYRKVVKATNELIKKMHEIHLSGIVVTLLPVIRQCSVLVYNKSHVPTILDMSTTNEHGLGPIAHEVLKEISSNHPEVLKAHVRAMCATLQAQVPKPGVVCKPGTVQTLRACAGFAQRYPAEIPHDRQFLLSMVQYAVLGTPPEAAKFAVSIVVATEGNRDLFIKDIVSQCSKKFTYGSDGFLSKLAALSQLMLLAAKDIEEDHDNILAIAIQQVLLVDHVVAAEDDAAWTDDMDEHLAAKVWALKLLVNRLRSYATSATAAEIESTVLDMAKPVYKLLRSMLEANGELSKNAETPAFHKSRMRLTSAVMLLKLSAHKRFDHLLTPRDFNLLATVAQDELAEVRSKFVDTLKKYLGQSAVPIRFYTIPFLYAFEPREALKEATANWLRARSSALTKSGESVMELVFARFLSLLAHHPDFSMETQHLEDFVGYIMFYLKIVATQKNLPLIYHVAQRVKSVQDGIDPAVSENLYCLSDIAQAVIREFQELQGWSLQTWSSKLLMPAGLFAGLPSHSVAQDIADRQYAPEELINSVEALVKQSMRSKKRKADASSNQAKKRSRPGHAASKKFAKVKTPRKRRGSAADGPMDVPVSEKRRSTRTSGAAKNYAGMDDSEDGEDEGEGRIDADVKMEDERANVEVDGDVEASSEAEDEEDKENGEPEHPPTPEKTAVTRARPLKGAGKKVATTAAAAAAKNGRKIKGKKGGKDRSKKQQEVIGVPENSDEELSDAPEEVGA